MRAGVPSLLAACVLALVAACGGAPPPHDGSRAASTEASAIVSHKCTKCHAAPERGKHTRAELEAELGRHRARVKLTDEQWDGIVALLMRDGDEAPAFR